MDLGLRGKVAIVAGASSGLGLAIAREFALEGAALAISSRSPERLEAARDDIAAAAGRPPLVTPVDVRDPDAVDAWVRQVTETLGGPDIVVANAGGPQLGTATDFGLDDYRAALELNLLSSIAIVQAALPALRRAEWGRILFVASAAAKEPVPTVALSNTARAGLLGYAKSLVHALGAGAVTVNVLAPGPIRTDRMLEVHGDEDAIAALASSQIPLGRVGTTEEFAAAAAFLASARASFITGTVLQVDGGMTRSLI